MVHNNERRGKKALFPFLGLFHQSYTHVVAAWSFAYQGGFKKALGVRLG